MEELDVERIAAIAHEVNRAYCQSLGDDSQVPWNEAPDWQQQSAIKGVLFNRDNDATPQQNHSSWMEEKRADGWVHGHVKDAEAKTHPCMVPYEDLPAAQRLKDSFFRAVVRTALGKPV